ncbi:MAG: DUF1049 domain-containing protein [Candidatus Magnetomorum sp.]|nr:DUF1049 domain-containing protein [Candidatus Magnetomorum sp.]
MFKTINTIILTVLTVLFSMQNFEHVPVYFLWGKAISIRLIFVIAISGVFGYLIRHFIGIGREERLKRRLYHLTRRRQTSSRKNEIIFEDDV